MYLQTHSIKLRRLFVGAGKFVPNATTVDEEGRTVLECFLSYPLRSTFICNTRTQMFTYRIYIHNVYYQHCVAIKCTLRSRYSQWGQLPGKPTGRSDPPGSSCECT